MDFDAKHLHHIVGKHSMSVHDIAVEAGVSTTTIYNRLKNGVRGRALLQRKKLYTLGSQRDRTVHDIAQTLELSTSTIYKRIKQGVR